MHSNEILLESITELCRIIVSLEKNSVGFLRDRNFVTQAILLLRHQLQSLTDLISPLHLEHCTEEFTEDN